MPSPPPPPSATQATAAESPRSRRDSNARGPAIALRSCVNAGRRTYAKQMRNQAAARRLAFLRERSKAAYTEPKFSRGAEPNHQHNFLCLDFSSASQFRSQIGFASTPTSEIASAKLRSSAISMWGEPPSEQVRKCLNPAPFRPSTFRHRISLRPILLSFPQPRCRTCQQIRA